MAVADDHQDAPRLDGLALNQLAAGASHVDGVVQRRSAAGLQLLELLHHRLGIGGGVHQQVRGVGIADQVAAELRIVARNQVLHQLDGRVLIVLPMQAAGVAQIDQESDHHRLAALAGEELDLLLFALVENGEILLLQIRHEAALFVGHGHRNDDFVHLHLNGGRGWGLEVGGRVRFLRRRGLSHTGTKPLSERKREPQVHVFRLDPIIKQKGAGHWAECDSPTGQSLTVSEKPYNALVTLTIFDYTEEV